MNRDAIARLYAADGPFVSIYMTTEGATDNAAQQSDLVWKNLRKELLEAGADEATVATIDPHVHDAHTMGNTLVAIAARGTLLHLSHMPEPPKRDMARFSPLPHAGPLVEWAQSIVPHAVLLADRKGADIVTYLDWAMEAQTTVEEEGDNRPIHKSKPGGWSQRRYQQRAENAWDSHAHLVAEELAKLVDSTGLRLIVAAGDVRALQFLQDAASDRVRDVLTVIEGGSRHADGSTEQLADEAVKQVATLVAQETVAILEKFAEERGQHDRAADGAEQTLVALSRAQVDTLLVHDDPGDERTAFHGADAVPVALESATLKDLGVDDAREARLVDVAIRTAFGTGASVRIVPSKGRNAPSDGMGALLRYAT